MYHVIVVIQNMQMVPVPAQGFGNFFEGDCYIILHVSFQRGCREAQQ